MDGDNDHNTTTHGRSSSRLGITSQQRKKSSTSSTPFTIPNRNRNRNRSETEREQEKNASERIGGGGGGGDDDLGYRQSNNKPGRTLEERLANFGISLGGLKDITEGTAGRKTGGDTGAVTSGGSSSRRVINLIDSGADSGSDSLSDRKSARLSSDINRRISGISSSMEEYDKKVRDVTESINEVYRKSMDSMRSRRAMEAGGGKDSPGASSGDSLEAYLRKSRDNLAKDLLVELGPDYQPPPTPPPPPIPGPSGDNNKSSTVRKVVGNMSPRKIFGLDASAILETTSSEDSSSDEDDKDEDDSSTSTDSNDSGPGAMRISIRHATNPKADAMKRLEATLKNKNQKREPRTNVKRRSRIPPELQPEPRSLSPIMPTLPDKQFKSILERREERVSRNLNSMKNELAQLNQKVELDRKKAGSVGGSSSNASASRKSRMEANTNYKGKPMRLMKGEPDKTLHNEFNEFVQATGGKAGGWERKDHMSFVKTFDIWKKHPNKLMDALKRELPHKKSQDIAAHIKWYERFEELSSQNKATVHKWSLEKRRENELVYQMGSASQRAKLEGEKRRQEHLRMIREQERDKSKQKLAQWKRAQSDRSASAITSATAPGSANFSPEADGNTGEHQANDIQKAKSRTRKKHPPSAKDDEILEEYRDESGNLDISSVRQHILEITAKVHSLDHPKREFLPPRSSTLSRKKDSAEDLQIRSFNTTTSHHSHSHTSLRSKLGEEIEYYSRGSVRLPEIEPDAVSRPGSRPGSRPSQAQRIMKLSEFRERDSRIMEAKKKAVEIARERRKTNLNQLTADELKRRIRSRTGPSQIMNPTKQSELRKSLTHLERLEMLSKQDLSKLKPSSTSSALHPSPDMSPGRFPMESDGLPPIINQVPSKGVPTWRRPQHGDGL